MATVLLTAFQPYDEWQENVSWLVLQMVARDLTSRAQVTTRLYPVDFEEVRERLEKDIERNFDVAIHMGQAPGSDTIALEAIALNLGQTRSESPDKSFPLAADGPLAYRSQLPLVEWAHELRQQGVPANVSYHAGTYLCNAALYWSHYYSQRYGTDTRTTFLHLPLDETQTGESATAACLPASTSASAVQRLLVLADPDSAPLA